MALSMRYFLSLLCLGKHLHWSHTMRLPIFACLHDSSANVLQQV